MCTRKIGNKSCMARTHTRSTLIINLMRIELLFDFDLWPSRALRFIYLYFYINFYSVRFMFIFVPEPFVWRWREIEKSTDFLIQVSNLNRLDCADTKTGPFDKRTLWILCLWAVLVAFATQKNRLPRRAAICIWSETLDHNLIGVYFVFFTLLLCFAASPSCEIACVHLCIGCSHRRISSMFISIDRYGQRCQCNSLSGRTTAAERR